MKLRLHEIEFGVADVEKTSIFYQSVLGFQPNLQQQGLTVFNAGVKGLDFNVSTHFPKGIVAISFLTDDLVAVQERVSEAGIAFEGPSPSHLGMTCIQFNSPDGYLIKINTPGPDSPDWLQA